MHFKERADTYEGDRARQQISLERKVLGPQFPRNPVGDCVPYCWWKSLRKSDCLTLNLLYTRVQVT